MKYKVTVANTRKIWLPAVTIALTFALAACSDFDLFGPGPDLDHSHQWSNWNMVEEASFGGPGMEAQLCSICGEIEFRHIGVPVVTNLNEWKKAVEDIKKDTKNTKFIITIKGTITGITPSTGNTFGTKKGIEILLTGSGILSLATGTGHMLYIGNGQKLGIDDANLTLRGRSASGISSIIGVGNGGEVGLQNGSITGNTSDYGGGVYVYSGGIFAMDGGKISGNSAKNGGGVFVGNGGKFIMSKGEISGNTSSGTAATDGGGGVRIEQGGIFTLDGGKISGNSARSGGGVSVGAGAAGASNMGSGGKFIMNKGEISGNTTSGTGAYEGGGGVKIEQSGGFIMRSGKISGNSARYGGGMYVNRGFSLMTGGEISGNKATTYGGGVYTDGTNSTVYFLMVTGTVYGSNGSAQLRNLAGTGTTAYAALREEGTAQRGTLNRDLDKILNDWEKSGTVNTADWKSSGDLSGTYNTINVVNGVLR